MFIKIDILSYQDLEVITVLLLNRIIEKNIGKIKLDDVGIAKTVDTLNKELIEKEHSGDLGPIGIIEYNKHDILKCARTLLENQMEQVKGRRRSFYD